MALPSKSPLSPVKPVPTTIDFRDCVHQGVAGTDPDQILACIRAEYCLPRVALPAPPRIAATSTAVVQLEDFAALAGALGREAFRQLTADVLRHRDPGATLAQLPEFLAGHRYGRATPALIDLAKLDLAMALSDRAPGVRSIGACCLPADLLRAHPDLTLAFHPAWRWLELASPADHWRAELLAGAEEAFAPAPRRVQLRLHPRQGKISIERLSPIVFAFEQALQRNASLRQAEDHAAAATSGLARFDAVQHLQTLLIAGAIVGMQLHPEADAGPRHPISRESRSHPHQSHPHATEVTS